MITGPLLDRHFPDKMQKHLCNDNYEEPDKLAQYAIIMVDDIFDMLGNLPESTAIGILELIYRKQSAFIKGEK